MTLSSRLLALTLSLSLIFTACGQPDNVTPAVNTSAPSVTQAQTDAALHTFAQQLASAVTDPGVRTLIAQQTALKFDGDTEALYSTLASQSTSKGTFAQALSSGPAAQRLSTLAAQMPKLNIAVRGGVWDAAHTVPLVAVAAEGGDEYAPVIAYDAQGGVHQLDSRTAPDRPVIVVGLNERVDDRGTLLPQFLPTAAGTTPSLTAQGCYSVKLVRLDLYNDMEPWTKGKAEIWVAVKGAGIGWHGQLTMVTAPGDYLDAIQSFGCTDGDVHFYWYEKDGSNFDVSIGVDGYSFGIKIDDDDDFLGSITMRKSLFEGTSVNERNLGNLKQYTH